MGMHLFLKGLIFGLAIAAPVGPIGVLCINRTISQGRRFGFISGLGAASADAVYGAVAAFGLHVVARFLLVASPWIHFLGGLFLIYLGLRSMYTKPGDGGFDPPFRGLLSNYLSTLALTLGNPMTIVSFIAIFATLGVQDPSTDHFKAPLIVLGVFVGSSLWWFILTTTVSVVRQKLTNKSLNRIAKLSSLVLLGFGIAGVGTAGLF